MGKWVTVIDGRVAQVITGVGSQGRPGAGLEFQWSGATLGVRPEGSTDPYDYSPNLTGPQGDSWDGTVDVVLTDQHRTIEPGDESKLFALTGNNPRTFTLKADAGWIPKSVVAFTRTNTPPLTIKGASGVTINGVDGGEAVILYQYSSAAAVLIAPNSWLVTGDI